MRFEGLSDDHAASLDPEGLTEYVRLARRAAIMRGSMKKTVLDVELDVRTVSRQSLTVRSDLPQGHTLTRENLTVKRPADGRSPMDFWRLLGALATRDYEADEAID